MQPDSWLGRHHIELQWTLLIAGLCLRLLAVNNHPLALAVLLLGTIVVAMALGWSYGGKAWCQYIYLPNGPRPTGGHGRKRSPWDNCTCK